MRFAMRSARPATAVRPLPEDVCTPQRAASRDSPSPVRRAGSAAVGLTVVVGMSALTPNASADTPASWNFGTADRAVTDELGQVWQAAQGFEGGWSWSTSPDTKISGTDRDSVYRTEHAGMTAFRTDLPNGTYAVQPRFAEIYHDGPGQRIFDVAIEGKLVLDDLDIHQRVGRYASFRPSYEVTVADGRLDIEFAAVVDNPQISAVEVTLLQAAPVSPPPVSPPPVSPPPVVQLPVLPLVAGRPGPDNTGVPSGTALTPRYGDLVVTTPGTRLDGIDLHGFLDIKAPDVVVTNSVIRGRATSTNKSLIHSTGARVTITDTTLVPSNPSVDVDGLKGYGFTASRLDISGTVDTALIYGSDTSITNSWLHDNAHYASDPSQGGGPSHDDNVQVQGGNNIRIKGNSMSGAHNAAVQVTQDYAVTSDLQITGNWLGGGGCTVNIAQKARGPISGLVLADNRYARDSRLDCAVITPTTTLLSAWSNVWADTLTPVRIRYN